MHLQISFFVTFVKKKSGLCASRAFPPMGGHYAKRALRSKCVYSINLISNIFFLCFLRNTPIINRRERDKYVVLYCFIQISHKT